jgi:hypothetical protein
MKIYLDFDGTVVEHVFPGMGRCNFGCFEVIKKLQDAGHEIILNTYRADLGQGYVKDALSMVNDMCEYFIKDRSQRKEFELLPISALDKKIHPPRFDMEEALRSGELFIDDNSYGTPLKPAVMSNGMMVDWDALDVIFERHGLYKQILAA